MTNENQDFFLISVCLNRTAPRAHLKWHCALACLWWWGGGFSEGANGITPYRMSGGKGGMGCNTLAESGTNQLELNFLAQITNNPSYGQKSAAFYPYMDRYQRVGRCWYCCCCVFG